ncbi:hypothetical protein niasHT_032596 [Heterodera trifolii]|uniref:Uncharacterized protein n=1 Tax=Heterodera trifolii TaxID=157864 RepID=A0ABD2I799_9BILA
MTKRRRRRESGRIKAKEFESAFGDFGKSATERSGRNIAGRKGQRISARILTFPQGQGRNRTEIVVERRLAHNKRLQENARQNRQQMMVGSFGNKQRTKTDEIGSTVEQLHFGQFTAAKGQTNNRIESDACFIIEEKHTKRKSKSGEKAKRMIKIMKGK